MKVKVGALAEANKHRKKHTKGGKDKESEKNIESWMVDTIKDQEGAGHEAPPGGAGCALLSAPVKAYYIPKYTWIQIIFKQHKAPIIKYRL